MVEEGLTEKVGIDMVIDRSRRRKQKNRGER